METVMYSPYTCLVLMAVACAIFMWRLYLAERRLTLWNLHLNRTVDEIYRAVNAVDYHGSVPPVAVERFMGYIKHSDPSFDAAAIIQQELNNQRSGPRGSAIVKLTEYKVRPEQNAE